MPYTRSPGFVGNGHIGLRPLRIVNAPYLTDRLRDKDILTAKGLADTQIKRTGTDS